MIRSQFSEWKMNESPVVPVENPLPKGLRTDLIACINCHSELEGDLARLVCPRCARVYPIIDGIPCFAEAEVFYDEYASRHCPFAASPTGMKRAILQVLPFWSWREWKFWQRAIPQCGRLLAVGCGPGPEIFLELARGVVGYDCSLSFFPHSPSP